MVADGREREAIERLVDVVREELNVRRVRFVAAAEELGSYEVKANYRTLGPLFGKDMPLAADAIAALDPAQRGRRDAATAASIGIAVGGREHTLVGRGRDPDDARARGLQRRARGSPRGGAGPGRSTSDLREEGRAREIVHAVQNARKTAGLQVEDRIELALAGDAALMRAAEAHRDHIAGETLAVELTVGAAREPDGSDTATVEGLELAITLSRAG